MVVTVVVQVVVVVVTDEAVELEEEAVNLVALIQTKVQTGHLVATQGGITLTRPVTVGLTVLLVTPLDQTATIHSQGIRTQKPLQTV